MGDGNEIGDYEFNDTKAPLNDCLEQRNRRGHAKRHEARHCYGCRPQSGCMVLHILEGKGKAVSGEDIACSALALALVRL